MKNCYCEIKIQNSLYCYDKFLWNDRDMTFKRGSMHIDSIALSKRTLPYLEESMVIDWDEKVNTDHGGCVVDLNLEEFFQENMYALDFCNRDRLDPSTKSHRKTLTSKIEERLNIDILEERTCLYDFIAVNKNDLEITDVEIINVLITLEIK